MSTTTGDWRALAGTTFETFKQPATGSQGMVATNHPLGSAAGLEMLAMGGNAVDAAIAAVFALSVVEPMMVGPLGGGYINIRMADGQALCIDNYTLAPGAATPDMYTPVSDAWPDRLLTVDRESQVGHRASGVPGNLKGWDEAHAAHGRLAWETIVAPAIRYAADGFVCSEYLSRLATDSAADIARFTATAAVFQPGGRTVAPGDRIVQPQFADSLRLIAAERSAALYYGELGRMLADDMADNGGMITTDDLASYTTRQSDPVRGTYRGHEITGPPPGNSGITLIIEMFNILEGFDIASMGFGTVESSHLLLEVLKIAFADRFAYLGDPETVDIPLEWLTSKHYGASRQADIDLARASIASAGQQSGESSYTTHLTAADADGNIVAMTQTINELFGSKVMVPGTGLLLNNTQALFDPHPGTPNSIRPGKRVVSSMAPVIVSRAGRPWLGLGTPGGVRIFPSVFQALVNVIDHGMSLQQAVEAPRLWTQGQDVELEAGFDPAVRSGLQARGHEVTIVPNVAGGMNGVQIDPVTGTMLGAACWRADGSPAGLAGGTANVEARFNPLVSG
ncbi:MAG: gamma-glutamyltransferase [Actinomycetota bacterium]